ncbi:DUF222 domain-containing protein [Schaalia sp. 19OD2882]|uniref:HNH endonuclease signature motif containing protein n=1 Tax=Schaalia sp. 19OD2882 TaxID=2794089 RepID=UPI001C1EC7C0|nr:HNH endonuclease signature motif containing protein [Schaalia sp. 19OD2882]QWW19142.1 DUF222 domain-containing protein [Schaalia sp. 19OD2882]
MEDASMTGPGSGGVQPLPEGLRRSGGEDGAGLALLVRQVRSALQELVVGGRSEALADAELVQAVRVVESLGVMVDSARAILAGEVTRRCKPVGDQPKLHLAHDARSSVDLLTRLTGASGSTVTRRSRMGRTFEVVRALTGQELPATLPLTRAAFQAGLIGTDTVRALMSTLGQCAMRPHHPDLLEVAERAVIAQTLGVGAGDGERGRGDEACTGDGQAGTGEEVSVGGDETAIGNELSRIPDLTVDDLRVMGGADPLVERMVLPADTVAQVAQLWVAAIDPDGTAPDERERDQKRGLSLTATDGGMIRIRGLLVPEIGAQLQRLIDAVLNPRVNDAPKLTGERAGGEGLGQGEYQEEIVDGRRTGQEPQGAAVSVDISCDNSVTGRTRAQKMHDALGTILSRAATLGTMPTIAGAAPTLVVNINVADLADPRGLASLTDVPAGPGRIAASVISSHAARHMACDGVIDRVVTAANGKIIALDSQSRTFTTHQRRAIEARDGGCVIPGCTVGPAWCEVHHVHEHSQGGPTHTDNGVLLCWHHHRTLHRNGWAIRFQDGAVQVRPPGWMGPERLNWIPANSSPGNQLHHHRTVADQFWSTVYPPGSDPPVRIGAPVGHPGVRAGEASRLPTSGAPAKPDRPPDRPPNRRA